VVAVTTKSNNESKLNTITSEINAIIDPNRNAAAGLRTPFDSTTKETGTSSIEIDEVSEAIAINAKNAKATKPPTAPIESNNAGNTEIISPGPAIRPPCDVKYFNATCERHIHSR